MGLDGQCGFTAREPRYRHHKGGGCLLLTELYPANCKGQSVELTRDHPLHRKCKQQPIPVSANAPTAILDVTQQGIQGEAQGLCTSTSQTRRLAFIGHHVVSLDMPPLCKWPEVVGVPIVSGDGQCSDVVTEVFGHLRGYLCPPALAGIYPKLVLVVKSSRERLRSSSFPEDSVC